MWKWALFNRDKKIPENFPQISHQKQNMLNFILINKLHKIAASIWHMTDIWMWPGKTLCLFSPRICFGKAYVIRRKRLRHIFSSFIFPQKIQALNVFLKYLFFFFFPMLYWLFLSPSLPCNVNMWHAGNEQGYIMIHLTFSPHGSVCLRVDFPAQPLLC